MDGTVVADDEDASTAPEVPQEPPDSRLRHRCAGQGAVWNGLHLAPVDVRDVVGVIGTDPLKVTRATDPEDWPRVRSQPPAEASQPGYGIDVGHIRRDQTAIVARNLERLAQHDSRSVTLGGDWHGRRS